jgi:intracellular sulfur oxidation DsrE/DsrF family protein
VVKEGGSMKTKPLATLFLLLTVCCCGTLSDALAAEYKALRHIKEVKAVFDFRIGDPKSAALQMNLIHDIYRDLALMKKKPAFVVVFMGPSVKLVSKKRDSFGPEDQKTLNELAAMITAMARNDITFEICLVSAEAFEVYVSTLLPEITKVENGWISEIGYQVQGYSLVPVF